MSITLFISGVLIVSHDQHLLTSVCSDLYVVDNGKLEVLRYGHDSKDAFEQYKKDVVTGKR
jgi:ATPase subunit of ABC transporter with duplicated ATPase domains